MAVLCSAARGSSGDGALFFLKNFVYIARETILVDYEKLSADDSSLEMAALLGTSGP